MKNKSRSRRKTPVKLYSPKLLSHIQYSLDYFATETTEYIVTQAQDIKSRMLIISGFKSNLNLSLINKWII